MEVVPTLEQLVQGVDALMSIVPPGDALEVGTQVSQAIKATGKALYFIEANAIAPMTGQAIGQAIAQAGGRCIDGSIIGSAAKIAQLDHRAILYLSGPDAPLVASELRPRGLRVEVLGTEVGQASAFKMAYAGFTKGTTSLLIELTLTAHAWGFLDAILDKYQETYPDAFRMFTGQVTRLPEHAARRAEEMTELTAMVEAVGLVPIMAPGADQVLRAMAQLAWDPVDPVDLAALTEKLPLRELIPLLAAKGVLRATEDVRR
jgi:3-hydroxyisobutyrate dehydrogenase-like beta-hydroxyacid dehydrogenase